MRSAPTLMAGCCSVPPPPPSSRASRSCMSASRPPASAAAPIAILAAPPPRPSRPPRAAVPAPADPLFDALREARRALAAESGVPAYVIFHDSTLREIAAARPRNLAELAEVNGVGEAKLARYGDAML